MVARRERPALIVAGMHRSGTSIVSLAVQALGIDLGGPGAVSEHNPAGYGEDEEFVALHKRMILDAGFAHDWAHDPTESFDPACFDRHGAVVDELLERDSGAPADEPWGWKDPRTSLVLGRWVERLRDPRVLVVVRPPDAVASSMARLGHPGWDDPAVAHHIWRFYNRRLLDFVVTTTVPCAVVRGSIAIEPPDRLASVLHDLGLPADAAGVTFDHLRHGRFAESVPRHRIPLGERMASERLWWSLQRRCA